MGEGVALHIGAVDFTWGELRWFAVAALAAGVVPFGQWARWQLRAWRIRRAIARSDYDHADLLALNQDEEEGPRSLRGLLTGIAFMAIGTPALIVFQINFADELGRMLGEGWSYVALPIAFGLVTTCAWMWQRVKRNAMSPEELAAIEEEEEHRSWMRAFFNEPAAGLGAAAGIGIVIVVVLLSLLIGGLPG
ncbi:MAG: hypothetical protein CL807_10145 [Citromicrobium sp.]|nr:hypothetical protein [Citromicrobium sp.]MBT48191.1 hypothetical protein [Citromicrobium sp.]|tara:strand:+ start:1646 stop:2221 length:576 start_codon:yes stop_codon:yes gene_type:complete